MPVRSVPLSLVAGSALVAVVLGAAGCVAGNSTRIEKPTLGRELTDLKQAYDTGAITQAEYERQKARFLGQPETSASSNGGDHAE